MVLLVAAILGLVNSPWVLLVPVLTFGCGILFAEMAIFVASISPSYDFFNYYFTLVVTPMFLFSGIFFPLSQLPNWAQTLAWFSPLTHATELSRALFHGSFSDGLVINLLCLGLASLIPWLPIRWSLRKRLIN